MTIFALDTASEFGSIALRRDGRTVFEVPLHAPEGFSQLLFPAIKRSLEEAEVVIREIDCFAAASGPGSFTGIRVGLSAVKGLAEGMGKSLCGVSNLRAVSSFGKNVGLRAVALDARRGDIYAAVYDHTLQIIVPEAVYPSLAWLASLDPAGNYEFIFPAHNNLDVDLAASPFRNMASLEAPKSLAAAVALCAERDGHAGLWTDPATLDANYVRRADAELSWKDR